MRTRFPLIAQLLLALALSLAVMAALILTVFGLQFGFGGDLLVAGRAGERVQTLAELVQGELHERPRGEWDAALARFSEAYRVRISLWRNETERLAGEPRELPAELALFLKPLNRRPERPGPPGDDPEGPPERRPGGPPRPEEGPPPGQRRIPPPRLEGRPVEAVFEPSPFPAPPPSGSKIPAYSRSVIRAGNPSTPWLWVRYPGVSGRPGVVLVVQADSGADGLLADFSPWLYAATGFVVFIGLFWFFLARSIAAAVSRATIAAEAIADGHFEVRVPDGRPDELGRLGGAVNRLALRLEGFVTGQKRFLGDTAHELCAPLARLEMGLSVLAQRSPKELVERLDDARDDVREMATLVQELLAFSKAGLQSSALSLERVELAPLIAAVVGREAPLEEMVTVSVPKDLRVMAVPDLLARAVANLVRNAFRHGAPGGPVFVAATRSGETVTLTVSDNGPGVPPEYLERIFEPFFRLDASRDRATGGSGLGLAIVRTCVQAGGGKVQARANEPTGLAVEITLKAAE